MMSAVTVSQNTSSLFSSCSAEQLTLSKIHYTRYRDTHNNAVIIMFDIAGTKYHWLLDILVKVGLQCCDNTVITYHDTVWLPDCPQVDLLVVSSSDENPS